MLETRNIDKNIDKKKQDNDNLHYKTTTLNLNKYFYNQSIALKQFDNINVAKDKIYSIKKKTIDNLEKYLIDFEAKFINNGGKIIWAETKEDALEELYKIIKKYDYPIIKHNSPIADEINLNLKLTRYHKIINTDFGEFCTDKKSANSRNYLSEKNISDINSYLNYKYHLAPDEKYPDIIKFYKNYVTKECKGNYISISDANFLVADTGSIVVSEISGAGIYTYGCSQIAIFLAGIEKVIPSLRDIELFTSIESTYSYGINMPPFINIISDVNKNKEENNGGPKEVYLILVNNNRTVLLEDSLRRETLYCLDCGACLNVCPVSKFKNNTVISYPIKMIKQPFINNNLNDLELSYETTLCGKCDEICPAKISLTKLLLLNRKESERVKNNKKEKLNFLIARIIMQNKILNLILSTKLKSFILRLIINKLLKVKTIKYSVVKESFNDFWKKHF